MLSRTVIECEFENEYESHDLAYSTSVLGRIQR